MSTLGERMTIEKASDVDVETSTVEETLHALGLAGLGDDEIETRLLVMVENDEIDEGLLAFLGFASDPPPL